MSLTRIELYGHLRKRFGRRFMLAVGSPAEAIRALCFQVQGFRAWVEAHSEPGYRVIVGTEPATMDTLGNPVGGGEVIKIIPVVGGAHGDVGQILLGAALIYASTFIPGAWALGSMSVASAVSSIGFAMVLGGVASMLATPPQVGQNGSNGPSDMPSYSFGSPTVTIGQGRPVPLLYGQVRVGGAIVSAGIVSEGYQPGGFGGVCPTDDGTITGNGDSTPWVAAIAAA